MADRPGAERADAAGVPPARTARRCGRSAASAGRQVDRRVGWADDPRAADVLVAAGEPGD